ncbi:hypothetical protein D3C84_698350 [compost metagenome]
MAVAEHDDGVDVRVQACFEGREGLFQRAGQLVAYRSHPHQGDQQQRARGQQLAGLLETGEPEQQQRQQQ